MKRLRTVLAAFTVSSLVLGTPLSRGRADRVHYVSFDVAVTDKDDNPIVGLQKPHFKVFVDGVEQTITEFDTSRKPLAIVVLVEYSDTFVYYYDNVVTPAAGFIRTLQPKDWIGLVTFDLEPEIVNDFTRDRNALTGSLERLMMPFFSEASVYDAVYFALERMEDVEEKGAVLLLSSGRDTTSRHGYIETVRKAEASDTIVYSIGLGQFAHSSREPYVEPAQITLLQADNVMRSLAEATGGLAFFPRFSGDYRGIYQAVNADLRNRYTLGFISTTAKADGKLRKLKVEVVGTDVDRDGKPDKLKVRHKKGF